MGKGKKIGIGVGVVIGLFFIVVIAAGASSQQREDELKTAAENAVLSPETIKSNAVEISYDDLMRNNEDHVGKIVYHQGKVIQAQNVFGDTYVLRVGTGDAPYYYDDVIWVNYAGDRLLEDDNVEIWGEVVGLKEYTAILGNSITVPEIDALILDLVE